MTKRIINIWTSIDWWVVILYALLVLAGILNIYAASYDFDNANIFDFSERSGKQFAWIAFAVLLILVVLLLDVRVYEDFAYPIYAGMLVLLFITIFISPNIKGSHSWLTLGPVSIQPAEFAKFTTTLALAKLLSDTGMRLSNWRFLFIATGLVLAPMALIIMQNETGSALVYLAFFLMFYREGMSGYVLLFGVASVVLFVLGIKYGGMPIFSANESAGIFYSEIFVAITIIALLFYSLEDWESTKVSILIIIATLLLRWGISFFYLIPVTYALGFALAVILGYTVFLSYIRHRRGYLAIAAIIILAFFFSYSVDYIFDNVLKPHQRIRIEVTLGMQDDPRGVGYNVNQSKIAIGSGGLLGKGFLNGTQTKLKYVPEQDTDFIFCTVGEEWGFAGAAAVLTLFAALLIRLLILAERQRSIFARVYGYCLISILILHLFINIGMTIGLTPVIGIPLPFFSYGGSSLWGFTIMLFVFLRLDAGRLERF